MQTNSDMYELASRGSHERDDLCCRMSCILEPFSVAAVNAISAVNMALNFIAYEPLRCSPSHDDLTDHTENTNPSQILRSQLAWCKGFHLYFGALNSFLLMGTPLCRVSQLVALFDQRTGCALD